MKVILKGGVKLSFLYCKPNAIAYIIGGPLAPNICGTITFQNVMHGVVVNINVTGLPQYKPATKHQNPVGPHGFHLHENGSCKIGDPENPFQAAGGHWNPKNQPHGNHAGDFPVLFSNNGNSSMCFFTNKFTSLEIIGKTVIIHENPDDYRTQPSGDSGKRLACGVIKPLYL